MKEQGSEAASPRVLFFVILSGGLQDAYTYFERGGVFANAQTGNVIFCSVALFHGEYAAFFRYLLPIAAFFAGVLTAEWLRRRWKACMCGGAPPHAGRCGECAGFLCLRHAGAGIPPLSGAALCQHHVHRQPGTGGRSLFCRGGRAGQHRSQAGSDVSVCGGAVWSWCGDGVSGTAVLWPVGHSLLRPAAACGLFGSAPAATGAQYRKGGARGSGRL